MPLTPGKSQSTISHNIQEMVASGHPQAQAVAAAEHEAHKMAHGGASPRPGDVIGEDGDDVLLHMPSGEPLRVPKAWGVHAMATGGVEYPDKQPPTSSPPDDTAIEGDPNTDQPYEDPNPDVTPDQGGREVARPAEAETPVELPEGLDPRQVSRRAVPAINAGDEVETPLPGRLAGNSYIGDESAPDNRSDAVRMAEELLAQHRGHGDAETQEAQAYLDRVQPHEAAAKAAPQEATEQPHRSLGSADEAFERAAHPQAEPPALMTPQAADRYTHPQEPAGDSIPGFPGVDPRMLYGAAHPAEEFGKSSDFWKGIGSDVVGAVAPVVHNAVTSNPNGAVDPGQQDTGLLPEAPHVGAAPPAQSGPTAEWQPPAGSPVPTLSGWAPEGETAPGPVAPDEQTVPQPTAPAPSPYAAPAAPQRETQPFSAGQASGLGINASDAEQTARTQGANALASDWSEQADLKAQQAQQFADFTKAAQDTQNEVHQQTMQSMARAQDLVNHVANTQIDSHRWWSSRSPFEKAVIGIGLILGGKGSMDVVNKAIDRDVEDQKANLETGIKAGTMQDNLYARNLELLKSPEAATAATRWGLANQMLAKSQEISARFMSPQVQANAEIANAQARAKLALEAGNTYNLVKKQTLENTTIDADQALHAGGMQAVRALDDGNPNGERPHFGALLMKYGQSNQIRYGENGAEGIQTRPFTPEENAQRDEMKFANTLARKIQNEAHVYPGGWQVSGQDVNMLRKSLIGSGIADKDTVDAIAPDQAGFTGATKFTHEQMQNLQHALAAKQAETDHRMGFWSFGDKGIGPSPLVTPLKLGRQR